uniref:Major tail protein n=1 Tax=viral metagenome TaxID=1070528 RepID=A0A6M3K6G1_9ZZZZ
MPTKDKGAIKFKSGGTWSAIRVTDEGLLDTGETHNDFGYVKSSTLRDETEELTDFDESGAQVVSEDGNRIIKVTGLLMQTDKTTIDFFKETVRSKHYAIYHYDGVTNENYQEYYFGICKIKPLIEIASDTKRIPFEFSVLKNEAAIVMGGTGKPALPAGAHATVLNIAAGMYYSVTPTAVA